VVAPTGTLRNALHLTMRRISAVLVVLAVEFVTLRLTADQGQASGEPLTAKEVRKAEKGARTAEDHLRLAAYYESEARKKQAELAEQEELANNLGRTAMAMRTKIPNPYWNAQALARLYREQLKKLTRIATGHRDLARSLQAGAESTR
jgi:hypothetical protein